MTSSFSDICQIFLFDLAVRNVRIFRRPRTDWRKERETNQETFGHSAVRSLAYRRGRGFFGNRGGRGNFAGYRYNGGIFC